MTTGKKKQRWAILPPAAEGEGATSPDDVTQTRRRLQSDGTEPDPAVSRRRARTEPELPLDVLVQQVAPSTPRPEPVASPESATLTSPSREAATVPPDVSPTLNSPAPSTTGRFIPTQSMPAQSMPAQTIPAQTIPAQTIPADAGVQPAAVPTLVELTAPALEHEVRVVERSTRAALRPGTKATAQLASGEHGETLPSPPWREDQD